MFKVMTLKEALDKTERERARCDALNAAILSRLSDEEDYPVKDMNSWGEQERRMIDRHIAEVEARNRMGYVPGPSDGKPGNDAEVFAKQAADLVNSPSHYTQGPTESIDVIRQALGAAGFKGFCVGNAIKYVHRARFKGTEDTDLKKAVWYLRMAVGDDPRNT